MSRLNTIIECHRANQLYWMPNAFTPFGDVHMHVSLKDKYVTVPYVCYLVSHGPDHMYKEIFHAFF